MDFDKKPARDEDEIDAGCDLGIVAYQSDQQSQESPTNSEPSSPAQAVAGLDQEDVQFMLLKVSVLKRPLNISLIVHPSQPVHRIQRNLQNARTQPLTHLQTHALAPAN
jgi:hypothetical protein